MKTCPRCQQPVSKALSFCPVCGHVLPKTRKQTGPWIIDEVISEIHHSILYRVYQLESPTKYVPRVFKPDAPFNEVPESGELINTRDFFNPLDF